MHPVLFSVGHIHAYSYGFMIAVGALLAIFLSQFRANRKGMDGELVFNAAFIGLIAGLVGAKLTFIASNIKLLKVDPGYVLGTDGFTVYGGVVLGILVGILVLRRKKVDIPVYMDLIIPQIALAQGFGRIGCFLAGCCYGKATDSAFGVTFPAEAIAPSGTPLLPTQLMSAAGNFLIFAVLLLITHYGTSYLGKGKSRYLKPLSISGLYLILYGVGRFFIEFLRDDPRRTALGLTSNQYVSFAFLAVGIFFLVYGYRRATITEN